jgi:hypothetical protein
MHTGFNFYNITNFQIVSMHYLFFGISHACHLK